MKREQTKKKPDGENRWRESDGENQMERTDGEISDRFKNELG